MRQKVSESLCELTQAQQQQSQTHSWNAKTEFISVTSQTSRSLKQHLSRATWAQSPAPLSSAQCWRITRQPFTPVYQGFASIQLPPCCVLISVPRQGAQACPEGCPQVYQTPPLSVTRCSTSQCTQRVNSSRRVFSFIATSDFATRSCKDT